MTRDEWDQEQNMLEDLDRVREATRDLVVPGKVDVIAVYPWHGVSLRLWSGGDPATCTVSCLNGHRCGKTSRYYGLQTREATERFLADLALGVELVTALERHCG